MAALSALDRKLKICARAVFGDVVVGIIPRLLHTLSVGIRLFALAVLMNFEIGIHEAVALLVLFVSQVVAEFYVIQTYAEPTFTNISILILYAYTVVYIVLGVGLFVKRYGSLRKLIEHTASNVRMRTVVTSAGSNTHD